MFVTVYSSISTPNACEVYSMNWGRGGPAEIPCCLGTILESHSEYSMTMTVYVDTCMLVCIDICMFQYICVYACVYRCNVFIYRYMYVCIDLCVHIDNVK